MKDIELRFVEREMRKPIREGIAEIYMGKILQFRKLEIQPWNPNIPDWSQWEDVPFVKDEV